MKNNEKQRGKKIKKKKCVKIKIISIENLRIVIDFKEKERRKKT